MVVGVDTRQAIRNYRCISYADFQFFPLATSFLSSTRRCTREKCFILPWTASIIEDNDVGMVKKHSLIAMVYSLTTKFLMSSTVVKCLKHLDNFKKYIKSQGLEI